ncbi:MAG: acyl-CoA dehydrogenase family protein [Halioglobus sp.]
MDFGLTEEQREVQGLARQILAQEVTPGKLAAYDEYQQERFDRELWGQLLAAGLPGVATAQQYGGMGFGFSELSFFIEEVGRTIAPIPAISHCVMAMLPIQKFGSDALKEAILPRAASGEILLSAALTEPLNEDPANPLAVTAEFDGGDLRLSGTKISVPFALQSQYVLLAARTDSGVAVVLVDPAASGVTLNPMRVTTYEPQYELLLDAVRIPPAQIICSSDGEPIMRWIAQRTAAALCAHQLGASDNAMRMAASYTAEREQFGVPVATFQAVGHRMADCYIDVECLRLSTYQAISLLDSEADALTELQIAKIWAGDTGHRVSYAAQHVHGGMGIDRDYPLWRFCLWMRHNEMTQGSSAVHVAQLGARLAAGEGLFS